MPALIAFFLSSLWLGWTILVDFFVVPTVFQQVPDFFVAGNLGVAVFTKLNRLEFPLASSLFALICLHIKQTKRQHYLAIISIVLLTIAGLYLFSLTPKITELTAAWEYAEKMGTLGQGGQDVQQLHQSYHKTYIGLDTLKLLLISIQLIVLGLFLSRKTR
jgi:hypothetical protein